MKEKVLVACMALLMSAGLFSCALDSSHSKAEEEAKTRNAEIRQKPPEITLKGPPPGWTEEVLMGLFANGNELSLRVRSGGCTEKDDFWIWCHFDEKSNDGPPHYILTIYRKRRDECKAFLPSGVLIKFHLREELGLPNVFTYSVKNRVGTYSQIGVK